ncbi:hypothetical protein O6R05_08160 [Peptoniphilus equinus]|uniref:SH3 domain-containing protein n=1 Tax=Peptoniphilus equinus TaxID=3016343 RepID=A0ABY7QUL3_9FIRM|nr:hypothetical protein [Peptoniphilus equinus]WBW49965.1 hypothetical protein O6R05_08160 [Peptoniphilus equinus]
MEHVTFTTLPSHVTLQPDGDLQIIRAELTRDLSIAMDVVNLGTKPIMNVVFAVTYFNENSVALFDGTAFVYTVKTSGITPKTVYYIPPITIDKRFNDARAITVALKEYSDDAGKVHTTDPTLAITYELDLIMPSKQIKINKLLGPDIIQYGRNLGEHWKCVCGTVNDKGVETCRFCERNKYFILNNLTEPLINQKLLSVLSQTVNYSKEGKEALEKHLTASYASKRAPTSDHLAQVRVNETLPSKSKKFPWLKSTLICATALVIAVIGLTAMKGHFRQSGLDHAETLIKEGNYQEALDLLETLPSSEGADRKPLVQTATRLIQSEQAFEAGRTALESKEYLVALNAFKNVMEQDVHFKTSQTLISQAENEIVAMAQDAVAAENMDEAKTLLNALLDVLPESAKATALLDTIESHATTGDAQSPDGNEAASYETTRADMSRTAKNLLYTYQVVQAQKANLRISPSIDAAVLDEVDKGTNIYIKSTKIEGIERIWCEVVVETTEGEILEGWLSNKVFSE